MGYMIALLVIVVFVAGIIGIIRLCEFIHDIDERDRILFEEYLKEKYDSSE